MNPRFRWAAASLAVIAACSATRQENAQAGPLAARLLADRAMRWDSHAFPGFELHVGPGVEIPVATLADSVNVIRRDVLNEFGISDDSTRAHLFVLASRDEMRRLAGRPLAGFIEEGEKTGVFVASPGYHVASIMRHELTHLYTLGVWGSAAGGRWIVEGVAGMFAGACQGQTPDALAAGLLRAGRLPAVDSLARAFPRLAEDVAVPAASSLVGFVRREGGIAAIRQLWNQPAGASHPLGANGASLERAWRQSLDKVAPGSLDIPRVMREGC
jgi:hypothetical protein